MYIKPTFIKLYENQSINAYTYRQMEIPIEGIKFPNRRGKWSAIDFLTGYSECYHTGDINPVHNVCICLFALFEHDKLGDCTDYIVAYYDYFSGENTWKEIDGTFDDLQTALIDLEIVDID